MRTSSIRIPNGANARLMGTTHINPFRAVRSGPSWGPLTLFEGGELGAFYEIAPGTAYVDKEMLVEATPGDPVEVLADANAALIPVTVTNPGFDSATGWTWNVTNWNVSGGVANFAGLANGAAIYQTGLVVPGKTYRVSFDVLNMTAGSGVRVNIGSVAMPTMAVNGRYTATGTAADNDRISIVGFIPGTFSVDNIVVEEVPGTYLYQATTASQPIFTRHPKTGVDPDILEPGYTGNQIYVSQYDVTEPGVKDCYGLTFDGIDDALVSLATMNFSAGDQASAAFAGKANSLAARGIPLAHNGTVSPAFFFEWPLATLNQYGARQRGPSAFRQSVLSTDGAHHALIGIFDNGAPLTALHTEDTDATVSTATPGVTNYGNASLSLGSDNGTVRFNGVVFGGAIAIDRLLDLYERNKLLIWLANRTPEVVAPALIPDPAPPAEIVTFPTGGAGSAYFADDALDDGWTVTLAATNTVSYADGVATIVQPAAFSQDATNSVTTGQLNSRITTDIGDVDFEFEFALGNPVMQALNDNSGSGNYIGHGFYIEYTNGNSDVIDTYVRASAANPFLYSRVNGTGLNIGNPRGVPIAQRLTRVGTTITRQVSYDGVNFRTDGGAGWTLSGTVAKIGVMVYKIGNWGVDVPISFEHLLVNRATGWSINEDNITRTNFLTETFAGLSNWTEANLLNGTVSATGSAFTMNVTGVDGDSAGIFFPTPKKDAGMLLHATATGGPQVFFCPALRQVGSRAAPFGWAGPIAEFTCNSDLLRSVCCERNTPTGSLYDGSYQFYSSNAGDALGDINTGNSLLAGVWMRVEMVGPAFRIKTWSGAVGDEPAGWEYTAYDTCFGLVNTGNLGLVLGQNRGNTANVTVTIDSLELYDIT